MLSCYSVYPFIGSIFSDPCSHATLCSKGPHIYWQDYLNYNKLDAFEREITETSVSGRPLGHSVIPICIDYNFVGTTDFEILTTSEEDRLFV